MSKVLTTVASGFVGRALTSALAAGGRSVKAAMRTPDTAAFDNPKIETVRLPDLAEPIDWVPLLAGVDAVVHLAGIAHVDGPSEVAGDRVNRAATGELAGAAGRVGIARLVFVSSVLAQTGSASPRVVAEADPPRPTSAYGRAKLAAETAVRDAGVPYTILRPVLVCGPGASGNLAKLLKLAALPVP